MFKKKKVITGIIISFILLSGVLSLRDVYQNRNSYKNELIRFHVIANSDSPQDQALKLKVRDEVIEKMNPKFEKSSSIEETRKIISDNLNLMKDIAQNEVKRLNSDYDVNVEFGMDNFPTKSYGNFTLPAGEYQTAKIVIGEGKGQNWWCVMFPPLCFIDITNGLTNDRSGEELKSILSEDEYNMIVTAKSEEEVPLKLKFKVVEIFEKGKIHFAKMFVSKK